VRCFLALLLAAACHSGTASPPDGSPGDGGDGGHALPHPGFAAAWQVDDPAELVTGPATGGRAGDWEIANARVRFVIEDARPSDGFDPYGCSIAAADRQRDAGVPGESRWGEMWMGLNFRAPGCDGIQLVNDGRDGQPAVLRATGHDAESPFMASLFTVTSQPPPLQTTIFRDYALAPDSDALLFNLTLRNDGDTDLALNKPYIGMAMNRGLRHWVDGSGFDFAPFGYGTLNTSAQFYAAVGDRISYSVLELNAPFSPIINFAHVLIGQYPQVTIKAGQTVTFPFAIAVGTGDTGTLQAAHAEVLGASADLVPLQGIVIDDRGAPVASARVHVMNTAQDQAVAFARTAADGSWTSPVAPGNYAILALADDRVGSGAHAITVPSTGLPGVSLALGPSSRIDCAVTENGLPVPAKIVLEPVTPVRPSLPDALGEMWDKQPIIVFSPDGTAHVPVFPGQWHVTFSRGFEYDRPTADVSAPAGGSASATAVLNRVVDTTGWISGDFHVHAQGSPDADDLLDAKVRAFAGEGVEVPVSTEHEFIGDFGPTAAALGLNGFMHTIAGTELTTTSTGHFNVFPLQQVTGALNNGGFLWYGKTIPQVLAEARARLTPQGAAPVVQMNHPRTSGMAYLDAVHFDPNSFAPLVDAADWPAPSTWDAMEVWNGAPLYMFEGCPVSSDSFYSTCLLKVPSHPTGFDWFSFLDRGVRVTGTGNSDSHNASLREVGYPRDYLDVGGDDPTALTDSQVTAALRGMKVTISGGPFLTIATADAAIGGLAQAPSNNVHLLVKLQAPVWMGPLARLDIWQGDTSAHGAHVVQSIDLSGLPVTGTIRLDTAVDIATSGADFWLLATARGPVDASGQSHALWPVIQEPVPPYAITNPIFVDADGDGKFTPLR